jgi:hypothetical protein
MNAIALHREVRNAISLADELGRFEHALGNDELAGNLAAIRTVLDEIERDLGLSHAEVHVSPPLSVEKLERGIRFFRGRMDEVIPTAREQFHDLVDALEAVLDAEERLSAGRLARRRMFGVVPLARLLPQVAHSAIDYVAAGAYVLSAAIARTPRARTVGMALGGATFGVSLVSDHPLAAIQAVPIEAHAVADQATGALAIAAPFALGYARRDPLAAAIQIVTGICGIALSLVTDYEAARGATSSRRRRHRRPLVPEVQRPLEGLSGSSALPNARL